jgi:hypothetical protein
MVARCHFLQRQTTSTPILRTTANDVPYYVSTNFAEGRQDMRRVEEQVWPILFCNERLGLKYGQGCGPLVLLWVFETPSQIFLGVWANSGQGLRAMIPSPPWQHRKPCVYYYVSFAGIFLKTAKRIARIMECCACFFASADCVVAQSREHRLGGDVLHDGNEAKMHGRETDTTEAHGQGKICKRYGLKNLSYRGWYCDESIRL